MLVTVNDLKTYMDISFSNKQADAALMVLEGLQSELEAYLGRPIEVNEFTEEYRLESNFTGMPMNSFFYNDAGQSSKLGIHKPHLQLLCVLRKLFISKIHQ